MKVLLIFITAFLLSACMPKERIVHIPIKCDIEKPKRPTKVASEFQNIKNILIYTESLESALDFCINGSIPTKE